MGSIARPKKNAQAGKLVPWNQLVNLRKLRQEYFGKHWDELGKVSFGTSGHRGSSLKGTFNDQHIAAIAQAIVLYRRENKISGPLVMGYDTHALSEPAFRTALEVFAANGVDVIINSGDKYTPTPVVSRTIINLNRGKDSRLADGVVITPSHNGPADGGFKYNPPHGGPAGTNETGWIQNKANELLANQNRGVERIPYNRAIRRGTTHRRDLVTPFVNELALVVDMEAIGEAGINIGVDPMGGSGVKYWNVIADIFKLNLTVTNPKVDGRFPFMPLDKDLTIRMDCSSPFAMAMLIALANKFDIGIGNDTDFDRHGIVAGTGLMNPNHYLSAAIWYLMNHRPAWSSNLKIGKTLVTTSMIDKIAADIDREVFITPVGFKWFVEGLSEGRLAIGCEESAGASLLTMDGKVWTTDKDGFSLGLLAAEIMAVTNRTPAEIYEEKLVTKHGRPFYSRNDGPVTDEQKVLLKALTPENLAGMEVAGENIPVEKIHTNAPGDNSPIGGVYVVLEDGSWGAARPSGTEPKLKVYGESMRGEEHWEQIIKDLPKAIGI